MKTEEKHSVIPTPPRFHQRGESLPRATLSEREGSRMGIWRGPDKSIETSRDGCRNRSNSGKIYVLHIKF